MTEHQKEPGRGSRPATPRWVIILAVIFVLSALLVVILHFMGFGFGGHGMGGTEILLSVAARQLRA